VSRYGKHQKELIRNAESQRLEEKLERSRGTEQERRQSHAAWMPTAQDHDGDRDVTSSGGHLLGETCLLGPAPASRRRVRPWRLRTRSPRIRGVNRTRTQNTGRACQRGRLRRWREDRMAPTGSIKDLTTRHSGTRTEPRT
jgi:hypothetical protein